MFLTLAEPSRPVVTEAAGRFVLPGTDMAVPRIQIVTIEQAMALRVRAVRLPLPRESLKRAAKEVDEGALDF